MTSRGIAPSAPRRLIAVVDPRILEGTTAADAVRAFDGTVEILAAGGAAALVEPLASWADAGVLARRAHGLVATLWSYGAVLPGGASSVFAGGLEEARRWIGAQADCLEAGLARMRGRGEFVLSIEAAAGTPGQAPITPPSSGAAYLRARATAIRAEAERALATRQAAETLGGAASEALGGAPWLMFDAGAAGVDLCVLAETTALGALEEAIARSGVAAEVSGPWPPYSFAAAAWGDAEDEQDAAWTAIGAEAASADDAASSGGGGRSAA